MVIGRWSERLDADLGQLVGEALDLARCAERGELADQHFSIGVAGHNCALQILAHVLPNEVKRIGQKLKKLIKPLLAFPPNM